MDNVFDLRRNLVAIKWEGAVNMKQKTIPCPICGNKTRNRMREDTELKNFPIYCPKCKKESLIDVKGMQVKKVK